MKEQIRLRPANEEDIPMIFNSWLKSYRNSLFASKLINSVYFTEQHKVIERILKIATVIVACNNEDPTQIYGYIVGRYISNIFCLDYIYVKHPFRHMGMARLLFNSFDHDKDCAGIYTAHTRVMETLGPKFNLVYHPYSAFNIEEAKGE